MTVEAATTISQLNPAWPLFDDQIIEGDDHIRLLKTVLQADALSRSLGTQQTIVGPVTFNGLLTAKVGLRTESAAPFIDYRETDQALPLGLYRFSLSGNIFSFLRNTAVAGDFATSTSIWSYTPADGYLNFPTAKFTGVPRIETTQPRLEFRESDQVLPAGAFRLVGSASNFHIQNNTAMAGDFSSAIDIMKFTASTGRVSFGYPVDFTGGFSPGQSLELAGVAPTLLLTETDQTDPAGRFRIIADGDAVSFQKALTPAWVTRSNLWSYSASTDKFTINRPLAVTSNAPVLEFDELDLASPAGHYRFLLDGNIFSLQQALTANFATTTPIWSYDGTAQALNFLTAGVTRLSISSAGTVFTYSSGTMASILNSSANFQVPFRGTGGTGTGVYLGAAPTGTQVSTPIVSAETGNTLTVRGGVDTSPVISFRNAANGVIAYLDIAGTAAGGAGVVMTREKGDLRYATASSRRYKEGIVSREGTDLVAVFDALNVSQWTWGGEIPESDERHGTPGVGLIAEEVADVFPEAVTYQWVPTVEEDGVPLPETEKRINGLDPFALIALLVAKIKQLEGRLETVEGAPA